MVGDRDAPAFNILCDMCLDIQSGFHSLIVPLFLIGGPVLNTIELYSHPVHIKHID